MSIAFSIHRRCSSELSIKGLVFPNFNTRRRVKIWTFLTNMDEEDEYDDYNLSEFTEDDFAIIDAALQENASEKGGPKVLVQLEQPVVDNNINFKALTKPIPPPQKKELSPYLRFRTNGILSVTDLVAPAWYVLFIPISKASNNDNGALARCEVQFDYGLRQKRFRKLKDRPPSFISGAGKKIVVEKIVAARNDRRATRGKVNPSFIP
jgi:exonuclease V